jgi:predicted ribosome quality control (RQC) complex YloA/Tae2 family protein
VTPTPPPTPGSTSRPTLPELERFAAELSELVVGSVIEKVWRPTETSLLLEIRGLKALTAEKSANGSSPSRRPAAERAGAGERYGERPRLFVSLEHGAPWVAVTTRWPETPQAPDRETLELRKYLENRRITAVGVEADRRLYLGLHGGHAFIVQLAGRYPQAGVCDENTGEPACALLPTRAVRDDDSPPLKPGHLDPAPTPTPWLLAHAERAWAAHDHHQHQRLLDELRVATRRALSKRDKLAAALRADLEKTDARHELERTAALLAGSMHLVRPKADAVDATDWTTDPPTVVRIPLDPQLGASGNLERLHNRRRKLERQHAALVPQLEELAKGRAELTSLLSELDTLANEPPGLSQLTALSALESRLTALTGPVRGARAQAPKARDREGLRLPYRTFVAVDGSEILVGRSAKDNDALTFKVARGSDIFLHARDVPGSHVILCHRKKGPPHPEALLDAAALAAWLSKLREDSVVDVLWTEKKHVRKVKGSPGLVQTAATRNVAVRRDPQRIERLYRTLAGEKDTP